MIEDVFCEMSKLQSSSFSQIISAGWCVLESVGEGGYDREPGEERISSSVVSIQ